MPKCLFQEERFDVRMFNKLIDHALVMLCLVSRSGVVKDAFWIFACSKKESAVE